MLKAISPIDGRYSTKTQALTPYFSEYGLIKYRVSIEINYFIALLELKIKPLEDFPQEKLEDVRLIGAEFDEQDAQAIKDIEKVTNHDVKAVEYFIREKFQKLGLGNYGEMIHFGLTSQDVNNTAIPLSIKDAIEQIFLPEIKRAVIALTDLSNQWKDIPLLARTHGQPASPTLLGKEIYVFIHRLKMQIKSLENQEYWAKFGGAVGNLNAHVITYPDVDWVTFSNQFVTSLGLHRIPFTTQIDTYDHLAELFHNIKRINTILIDLCRDVWTYISMNYFTQKVSEKEVGSSTMPHKVNPIDFENAEGNLGLANALLTHLADKLPVSRLQRDLTDSTVLRNVGVPVAHSLIAIKSLIKGLSKLGVNEENLAIDLENNWAVVAEAYQSILRREGVVAPYELLKAFTRGKDHLDKSQMQAFIETLPVGDEVKEELRAITPDNYIGIAELPSE